MLIIGESLNATREEVKLAVSNHDEQFVQALAKKQIQAGAHMLDVNAAVPGRDEVEDLVWLVKTVQNVVDVPLVLDSANPTALMEAMAVHQGRPMINSISAESSKLEMLLSVVANNECSVIAMCMDDKGIPYGVEERLDTAKALIQILKKAGKKGEDIYIDPLVLAASSDPKAPRVTMDVVMELTRDKSLQVRTAAGVSNVSFGLPARGYLNRVFLTMMHAVGLDACIVNVTNKALMSTLHTVMGLRGEDRFKAYLKAYRNGDIVV